MDYNKKEILTYLQDILAIPSPSGYTRKVIDYLKEELEALHISYYVTAKGSLIATVKGTNDEYQRTFAAHADTLGAMVKAVKDNGALSLSPIGNYMMSCVEGENCTVVTTEGKSYTGTIQTIKPSVHVSGDGARELKRNQDNMEVVLDEKVFSKEDVQILGIDVGDYICIDTRTIITEKGFIKSRYLDDKASVAILLYVLKYLAQNCIKPAYTTNFYISIYEETGHGATACIPQSTKEFIAVDMGAPGIGQNSSEYSVCICAKDASGPYDYELRKKLLQICHKYNIPYRNDIYPYYNSDASAAVRAGWDVKTALVGPGIFASHAYERTHLDSILATVDLILHYIMED